MMIAQWKIDARFGYKQQVIELLQQWNRDIGEKIGWTADKTQILTGSIGANESTIITQIQIQDLEELNNSWNKLATIEAHQKWSKDLEEFVVSGTSCWNIYRIV